MLIMCVILMFLPAFYTVKADCGTGVEPRGTLIVAMHDLPRADTDRTRGLILPLRYLA